MARSLAPTPPTLAEARAVLHARFGFADLRPAQVQAVQSVLEGHDTLIVLATGGGKSICYQLPALVLDGLTVVISPLIALMRDQVDALERKDIPAAFINSTLTSAQAGERIARAASGDLRLLYLAPERADVGRTIEQLARIGVTRLAVDEAHCISEWGHDFRPSYRRIGRLRERLGAPPTVALTATATPDVRRDIVAQLGLNDPTVIVAGFDRTNLHYRVRSERTHRDKDRALIETLRERPGTAVVYAPTRKATERLATVLTRARIPAVAYHAGLEDASRNRAQDAFMREEARVVVATSAFGMGIDKADVRTVVHWAMPGTLEAYYQEAGRAGRDGAPAACVLLHSYPDRFTHEHFIEQAHPPRRLYEQTWRVLKRRADDVGLTSLTPESLASLLPDDTNPRHAVVVIQQLQRRGLVTVIPEHLDRLWVRLLATPERITRELATDRTLERDLLRALWRQAAERLHTGAIIALDRLPPGLGHPVALRGHLKRLEQEQFIWTRAVGAGIAIGADVLPAESPPLDWADLDARRRHDLDKLDWMQRYAYARICRRRFVLDYFGDKSFAGCSGCDVCDPPGDAASPARPRSRPRARSRTA
ncbi:MAG: RecQ family ATP-dependent DNA helicase [Gemmatimonadaceae bacterium]|nr:RecQ family ATP-dependent DNA helicase [Gemmatimonadaceae bacterium]